MARRRFLPIICRAFTKDILMMTGFVLIALVALFAFFDVMGRIGGRYSITQIFVMTALAIPTRVYEIMPIAVLLASVFVMSKWAARNEFTVLRVGGLSSMRLAKFLMVPGLILVAFTYLFGEFISPMSEAQYREFHIQARYGTIRLNSNRTGTWVREVDERLAGRTIRYINIKSMNEKGSANGWRVFEFSSDGSLSRIIRAKSGRYVGSQGWLLRGVEESRLPRVAFDKETFNSQQVQFRNVPNMTLGSSISPEIFSLMLMRPERMSMKALSSYISHLKQSRQQYKSYEIGFWNKVFYPIAILVMMALSMPFAYLSPRNGSMSIKIFAGLMLGLGFYTINNLFSYIGMINTWPALVVALVPSVFMLAIAVAAMAFVERR
ncbi:MAG TPA: LPS export ABC transporter permease LptG [Sutterella sp.]|nr:LPS export ABC transporter permease LptG [Sutterella sp.]